MPPRPNLANQPERTDEIAGAIDLIFRVLGRGRDDTGGVLGGRHLQKLLGAGVGGEQFLDLGPQPRVSAAQLLDRRVALRRVELEDLVEDRVETCPFFRRERRWHRWVAQRIQGSRLRAQGSGSGSRLVTARLE